jgi:hypothetical protein
MQHESPEDDHARLDFSLSFAFDASRGKVYLCYGPLVVCEMSIGDYKQHFGVEAVRSLLHGLDRRKVTR